MTRLPAPLLRSPTRQLVSVGGQAIDGDGTHITFASSANHTGNNADGNRELFLFDTTTNTFTQVTTTTGGLSAGSSSINADGTLIAFTSSANLTGGNPDGSLEIFLYDTTTNTFTQITNLTDSAGNVAVQINADGTDIVFQSSTNMTGDNPDGNLEIFLTSTICSEPIGPDLAITKTDSPDPVNAGGNITYTINLSNEGSELANDVTVTDAVPANTVFVSASVTTGTGWTITAPPPGGTGDVTFSNLVVDAMETATFQIVVSVSPSATTTITNSATAATSGSDTNSTNNTGIATTTVVNNTVMCNGQTATIVGNNSNNTINGTQGRDIIHGQGGNDTINGLGGNDVICGGLGNDRLNGQQGTDFCDGGAGNDAATTCEQTVGVP